MVPSLASDFLPIEPRIEPPCIRSRLCVPCHRVCIPTPGGPTLRPRTYLIDCVFPTRELSLKFAEVFLKGDLAAFALRSVFSPFWARFQTHCKVDMSTSTRGIGAVCGVPGHRTRKVLPEVAHLDCRSGSVAFDCQLLSELAATLH